MRQWLSLGTPNSQGLAIPLLTTNLFFYACQYTGFTLIRLQGESFVIQSSPATLLITYEIIQEVSKCVLILCIWDCICLLYLHYVVGTVSVHGTIVLKGSSMLYMYIYMYIYIYIYIYINK